MPVEGRIAHPDLAHINWYSDTERSRGFLLHDIGRYGSIEKMTHRTSVLAHEVRVANHASLFSDVLWALGVPIDQKKILFMADHHDDAEIRVGDIPEPVKQGLIGVDREEMEEAERRALNELESLIAVPRIFPDFYPTVWEEYVEGKTLEARIVNFADKWDGLMEAVHEVICGENRSRFEEVIEDYRTLFEQLRSENEDWQKIVEEYVNPDLFVFPDPGRPVSKAPEDLDYSTAGSFITSVAEDNPVSYLFWLRFNKFVFTINFLNFVFPGWMDKIPRAVLNDIERVRSNAPIKRTAGGVLTLSDYEDPSGPTFGESLGINFLDVWLRTMARMKASGFWEEGD